MITNFTNWLQRTWKLFEFNPQKWMFSYFRTIFRETKKNIILFNKLIFSFHSQVIAKLKNNTAKKQKKPMFLACNQSFASCRVSRSSKNSSWVMLIVPMSNVHCYLQCSVFSNLPILLFIVPTIWIHKTIRKTKTGRKKRTWKHELEHEYVISWQWFKYMF